MINFKNKNNLKKQKGVTLIEVLAVVIIGVLIIVGAFTLYGNAQDKQNENATMTGVMSIQANVRDLFYGQGYSEEDVTVDNMISAGGIPSSFPVNGGEVSHPLGGQITLTGQGSTFAIGVTDLPQSACITMSNRSNGFVFVSSTAGGDEFEDTAERTEHCQGGGDLFFISR